MQFNQTNDIKVTATYFVNAYRSVRGQMTLGDHGLYFARELTSQTIQIPYSQMNAVWVQMLFGRIPFGMLIETPTDRIQFRLWRMRGVVHVLNQYLPSGIVKHQRKK